MSPNNNYVAGRRFEYKRRSHYHRLGYEEVIRTAGSHGAFDLICINSDRPVLCVQCKRVEDRAAAKRLMEKFKTSPPFPPSEFITQVMDVYVKKDREVLSVEVLG